MACEASAYSWQDLIFGTKGELPELGEPHVARPRVSVLLEQATRKRLTTVIAGEGAGKTVSLSAYARVRATGSYAWYTADALDASPTDFLNGLRVTLEAPPTVNTEELPVLAAVVGAIKQRINRSALLIVIDEVQAAPARALALLLRYLPTDVRLLLAGRALPDGLGDLVDWYRVHNQWASLTAVDLALDPTETEAFARSYQRSAEMSWPGSFALGKPGASYVVDRVLPELGKDVVRVAALAAGLDRFDRRQFLELTAAANALEVLDHLTGWTPMLMRRGEQYEWAPGVANALLARLSDQDRRLAYLRAGDLLLTTAPLRAARCYLTVDAPDRAARALSGAPTWAWAALPSPAADLVRALPEPILAAYPSLMLTRARLALTADAPAHVLRLLELVRPAAPAEQVEWLALRARAMLALGQLADLGAVQQELRQVGERLRGIDGDAAANALAQAGTLAGLLGRSADATTLLRQALDVLNAGVESPQQRYLLAFTLTSLGKALIAQGDPRSALPLLDRAVEWAREHVDALRLDEATNNLAVAYAAVGQWAKAAGLLQERLDDETFPRPPSLRAVLLDSLSDVCMANGEEDRTIRLCRELLDLVSATDPYQMRTRGRAKLAMILARRGLLAESERELNMLSEGGNVEEHAAYLIALGVCRLAANRPTEAIEAFRAVIATVASDNILDPVRTNMWLALAYLRSGDAVAAARCVGALDDRSLAALGSHDAQHFAEVLRLREQEAPMSQAPAPTVVHALRRSSVAAMRPQRVEIRLLGVPQMIVDGEPVEFKAWAYRRALELFCYLTVRRKPVRRDEIVRDLMPDIDPDSARPSLSSALSKMRRTLRQQARFSGDPVIVDDRDRCAVDVASLAEQVVVDVDELDSWSRDVRSAEWSGPIAPLLTLTDGEFLEGFDGDWLLPFRRAYADIAQLTLLRALERCEAAGRLQDALTLATRLTALDPDDDAVGERLRALRRLTGGVSRTDQGTARAS